jgi:hypothetical protein
MFPRFLFVALLLLPSAALVAQRAPGAPPPTREVAAVSLIEGAATELYFTAADGERRLFQIGAHGIGPVNTVPLATSLELWRKVPGETDEAGGPRFAAAARLDLPAGEPGSRWVVVFYHQADGRSTYRVLPQGAADHPAGTVRMANFAATPVAFLWDGRVTTLEPGAMHGPVPGPVAGAGAVFSYGLETAEAWVYRAPVQRLRLPRPDMRLLVLFSARREAHAGADGPAGGSWVVRATRIYDRVPGK